MQGLDRPPKQAVTVLKENFNAEGFYFIFCENQHQSGISDLEFNVEFSIAIRSALTERSVNEKFDDANRSAWGLGETI